MLYTGAQCERFAPLAAPFILGDNRVCSIPTEEQKLISTRRASLRERNGPARKDAERSSQVPEASSIATGSGPIGRGDPGRLNGSDLPRPAVTGA